MKCNEAKKYFNLRIFARLLLELSTLEEKGILLNIKGKIIDVHFALALIIGDNLGVHALLGHLEGFSAHHPCRFCTVFLASIQEYTSVKKTEM